MKTEDLIRIKLTGHKPQFKELIGLTQNNNSASDLLDFMRFIHNGKHTCLSAQGANGHVESEKGSYAYTMYNTHILKTDIYRESKTLYKR